MLTIITVTKDDLEGIKRTVKSTEGLRCHKKVSQIIVDSSINCDHQFLKEDMKDKKNLKIYYQKPQGISQAFNYGIELAADGWLWFLNGGDEVHENLNTDLFVRILEESNSDAIMFNIELNNGTLIKKIPLQFIWSPIYNGNNWIPHPGFLVRRNKLIYNTSPYNTNYNIAMDLDLWIELFKKNISIDFISIVIATFYEGGISEDWGRAKKEVKEILAKNTMWFLKIWFFIGYKLVKNYAIYIR